MVSPEKRFKLSRREFEHFSNKGLSFYCEKKVRVEKLTLSIVKGRSDIMILFDRFLERITLGRPYAPSYIGVCVDGQHIHLFWRKPFFITLQELGFLWDTITKESSNLKNRTASTKEKDSIPGREKLIQYLLNQEEHHEEVDKLKHSAEFFQSERWGKTLVKSKKVDGEKKVFFVPSPISNKEEITWNKFKFLSEMSQGELMSLQKYTH